MKGINPRRHFEHCAHCNRIEPDPCLGIVDAIGWCVRCGHPVCTDCSDWDCSLEGESWIGECQCKKCPPDHHTDCECLECMEQKTCRTPGCGARVNPGEQGMFGFALCDDCHWRHQEEMILAHMELI